MEKIAIIGAGASGTLLASILNEYDKYKIVLFEKQEHVAKKLLVTGNGKCNLTNMNMNEEFFNDSKVKIVLERVTPKRIIEEFERLHVKCISDEEGRVYPYSRSATSIANALADSLKGKNIDVRCGTLIQDIKYQNGMYEVFFNYHSELFDKVVIATGGIAYNGTDFYKITQKFGMKLVDTTPALCPIETKEKTISMSGLRVKAKVSCDGFEEDGEVLFKDNGLSGIVIFNASRFLKPNDTIHLNLIKDVSLSSLKEIELNLPKMIAKDVIDRSGNNLEKALDILEDYSFTVKAKYAYKFAQIMKGGIDTDGINFDTFEATSQKGLYILGEAMNVDGACGGYNLHFAFASSIICAEGLLK